MKTPRTWLLAAAFVVAPLIGLGIVLYGIGHSVARRQIKPSNIDYAEWRALRDLTRARARRDSSTSLPSGV